MRKIHDNNARDDGRGGVWILPHIQLPSGRKMIQSGRNVLGHSLDAANDISAPLKPVFDAVAAPLNKHANYVFPLSCISGALLVNYTGSSNDNPLLAAGGAIAAASNSVLFGANLISKAPHLNVVQNVAAARDMLKQKLRLEFLGKVRPAHVSMSGLAVAGGCYIASGLNVQDMIASVGDAEAFKDAVMSVRLPEITMGIAVGGAGLSKLSGAHALASKFGSMLPATLGYYGLHTYAQTGEVNVPILGAMFLYAVGAYTLKSVGKVSQPNVMEVPRREL